MQSIKGFRIVNIPLGVNMEGVHPLYIKEHSGGKSAKSPGSSGKILFVGNVDYRLHMSYESIDEYLRLLFSRFGDIKAITVSDFSADSTANTRFSHVEFAKKSALKFALTAQESDYRNACQEVVEQFGFETYFHPKSAEQIKKEFSYGTVDHAKLQQEVDGFMRSFEEQEALEKQRREEELNTVDEDGFMPVKNRNKRKRASERDESEGATGGGKGVDSATDASSDKRSNSGPRSRGNKKKKKDLELKNFYRFQIRQDKIKELEALRHKFAEDKLRVARLKESRKFKPF